MHSRHRRNNYRGGSFAEATIQREGQHDGDRAEPFPPKASPAVTRQHPAELCGCLGAVDSLAKMRTYLTIVSAAW